MLSEFNAAVQASIHAGKLLKGIADLKTATEINKAVIEIQEALLSAQGKMFEAQSKYEELMREKRGLEEKLVERREWQTEVTRYELKEIVPGICIYVLRADQANGEPSHWLCPHCFQQKKKSILQKPKVDYLNHRCPACQFEIQTERSSGPSMVAFPRRRRSLDF